MMFLRLPTYKVDGNPNPISMSIFISLPLSFEPSAVCISLKQHDMVANQVMPHAPELLTMCTFSVRVHLMSGCLPPTSENIKLAARCEWVYTSCLPERVHCVPWEDARQTNSTPHSNPSLGSNQGHTGAVRFLWQQELSDSPCIQILTSFLLLLVKTSYNLKNNQERYPTFYNQCSAKFYCVIVVFFSMFKRSEAL